MSVAEKLRQEGEKEGIQIGQEEGKLEGKEERNIEISKSMLLKGYPVEDIMLLTGLSSSNIRELV